MAAKVVIKVSNPRSLGISVRNPEGTIQDVDLAYIVNGEVVKSPWSLDELDKAITVALGLAKYKIEWDPEISPATKDFAKEVGARALSPNDAKKKLYG